MTGVVAPETHGLGMKLLWDGHGLDPYWGVVSVFSPDHVEDLDPFEAVGETWDLQTSTYWEGQIAPPDGQEHIDGGLNEYSYTLEAVDEAGDKDVVIQFRPGFPNAENVKSGNPMQGIPDDLPESIRVQVMSTNVDVDEALTVIRAFAEHIGLNRAYFEGEPHEYSRVYQFERYLRILRQVSEDHIVGKGGIIDALADFMSGQCGRGSYTWDNEEIVGHYLSVASDPDTWAMLVPKDECHGTALKNYHPKHPRASGGEDPLSHPKVEVSLSNEYDPEGHVPLSALDDLRDELDETLLNTLSWSGIPLAADSDVWVRVDPYFDVAEREESVEIVSNPLPELRDQTERHVESEMVRAELSDKQEEVLTLLADGGSMHYEQLAEEADVGTSTVYRLVETLRSLLETDQGMVQFADDVTRRSVRGIVDAVRETAEWASQSIREVARENDILSSASDPLRQWLDRHGIHVVSEHPRLEIELDRPVSDATIRQIMRAGLQAAEGSGLMTDRFEDALVHWRDRDGAEHRNWKAGLLARDALSSLA